MGLSDVERKAFLRGSAAAAVAMLINGEPVRVSAEGLDVAADDLTHLYRRYRADGAGAILIEVTERAADLVRMLRTAKPGSAVYVRTAELASDASTLAGFASLDQNDPAGATDWHQVAAHAAGRARNPDLAACSLEDLAWARRAAGDIDGALAALSRMPVKDASPATRASVELGRATILARAGRERAAHAALERAGDAVTEAGSAAPPGRRSKVTATRVLQFHGYAYVELGLAQPAYDLLAGTLAKMPAGSWLNAGTLHLDCARAAVQLGDAERAAYHAAQAFEVFASVASTHRLGLVRAFRREKLAPYGNVAAVRDLDELLATALDVPGPRYVLTRARKGGKGLHRDSCPYLRRGKASTERRAWTAGIGRDPAEVAGDVAVRAAFDVCSVCLPV
jgi:hypothetical protein